MTYTFKLSRRLAISNYIGVVSVFTMLTVLAACAGDDATGPSDDSSAWRAGDTAAVALRINPNQLTLETNQQVRFAGHAVTATGDSVGSEIEWTATGGSITDDGLFSSSKTGTFKVVGRGRSRKTDTSTVKVVAPQPTLQAIVVSPGSTSLSTGGSKAFTATGTLSDGTTTSVGVTWAATGGAIDAGGQYTAGSTAGTYRVIATSTSGTIADTAAVTLTAPSPEPTPVTTTTGSVGIPFGPFSLVSANTATGPFSLSLDSYTASNIVTRISAARTKGLRLMLAMTGGSHSNYMTNGVFDRSKWEAKMQTFNTSTIRSAVAAGVADGTIIGASVMDEPHVSGYGDGNSWGPSGTMTKTRVDSLCGYVKAIFPTLPVGVVHRHDVFEPSRSYYTCEFIVSQYSTRMGSVTTFRDGALAMAKRDGIAIAFSMNIINGGTQDRDGTWDCIGTGGVGTYYPNCGMTPQQIRDYGTVLGTAGCAFLMWRYDDLFMANPDNQQAFRDVGARLATAPAKACRRA